MTLFEPEPLRPARKAHRKRARRAMVTSSLSTILAIAVVFGGVYLIQHPQPIIDQVTVWQFTPPRAVETHVERLALTDHAKFLYYASRPTIETSEQFSASCPTHEGDDGFGILGCYRPTDKTIFLYDVTDTRLDGTEEITAAHEMLHAAWDRMGDDERARLTVLLEAEFETHSSDPSFAKRMEIYARIEPGEHANELHSIIGTEVAEISPELEQYYSTYFTDRSIVISLYAASNAAFVANAEKSQALVAKMDALRASIEADYNRYLASSDQLGRDVDDFNARAKGGQFESSQQFEEERAALVRRQASLDALFESISSRESQFNSMRLELERLNALVAELQRGLNIGGEVNVEEAG